MIFPLLVALALCVPTVVIALLTALVLFLRKRPVRAFVQKALWAHLFLLVFHAFVSFPGWLGWFGARSLGTRGDERAYDGPRITATGEWLVQSSTTLRAERTTPADEGVIASARALAVSLPGAELPSGGRMTLNAYRVPATVSPPRAVVVLVHGLFRSALELEAPARMWRDLGCECWLVEQRNHGHSGRATATFGIEEGKDLAAAVAFVQAQSSGVPVVMFGVSLGTVATSLALPQLDGIAGVVLDAPVGDVLATAQRMLSLERAGDNRRFFTLWEPWCSLAISSLQLWSGVELADVQPERALRGLSPELPILLIGGDGDDKVTPQSVRSLFTSLPMSEGTKELWIVPGAHHGDAWRVVPKEYGARLQAFLQRCR
jgi:hypothetical protein